MLTRARLAQTTR